MSTITEKTTVPIGFMVSLVGAIMGAVLWMSSMYAQGAANAKAQEETKVEILEIKKKQEKYVEDMNMVRVTLAELKALLKEKR